MKIFSGIQPTGNLHLGNYLGAIRQWADLQNGNDAMFCIVDLHAITIPQEPEALLKATNDAAITLLAAGVDPEKAIIFIQSHVPAHTELGWILNTMTPMGELERMTQFKDKSQSRRMKAGVLAGIFNYPSLMAADILLYQTEGVPVGADQLQHIELTRSLAERFNNRFGPTFVIPKALVSKEGARIMSLTDPERKMSKSDIYTDSFIALTDNPDVIQAKIKKAVTDSESEIRYDPKEKLAISNLISIFSAVTNMPIDEVEKTYSGKSYSDFKLALAEAVVTSLEPFQKKYKDLMDSPNNLKEILKKGAEQANERADKILGAVRQKIGLSRAT